MSQTQCRVDNLENSAAFDAIESSLLALIHQYIIRYTICDTQWLLCIRGRL